MSTETKPIRIVKLSIEAFKRLSAVDLTFQEGEGLIQITGKNGAGKSSVLDAIAAALGGKTLCPDKPIKKGHKKGSVSLDLGEFVVERTFTESGGTLTITGANGTKFPSPQAMLDKLFANLSFDPWRFMRMEPREQVQELRKVSGLEAKLTPLEQQIKAAAEERTEATRMLKMAEGAVKTLESGPFPDGPDEEISAVDLMKQIGDIHARTTEKDRVRRLRRSMADTANELVDKLDEIDKKMEELRLLKEQTERDHANVVGEVAILDQRLAETPDEDSGSLVARLRDIEATNAVARKRATIREQIKGASKTHTDARNRHKEAVRRVDELVAERENLLASAKFPVPGLGFDENGPTLDGLPLAQASSAQQLRASCLIVLAQNSQARIMTVREGALLDSDSREILRQIAEEHDAQIFLEVATDGEQVGIVIEDGMVKA